MDNRIKIDHTVSDLEVNLQAYDILQCDRTRNDGGFACFIRKDRCFNIKLCIIKEIENFVFEILYQSRNQILLESSTDLQTKLTSWI